MVKNHAYLAPRINLFSNVTCQNVALSCRRSFLGVGKQTEPLWRNAYGTCDLPKTADVADAAAARQDLGDVRTVDPQPVRKLRLGQALLLHERRQDSANARTAQRQRLFWCRAAMTSPALARERRPHKPPPQPVWPPGYKPRAIRLFLANAHGATGPPPTSRQSSDATPGTARWPRPRLRRRFPSVLTPTMQRSWHGHTRSEPGSTSPPAATTGDRFSASWHRSRPTPCRRGSARRPGSQGLSAAGGPPPTEVSLDRAGVCRTRCVLDGRGVAGLRPHRCRSHGYFLSTISESSPGRSRSVPLTAISTRSAATATSSCSQMRRTVHPTAARRRSVSSSRARFAAIFSTQ